MHALRAASFTTRASEPLAAVANWPRLDPSLLLDRVVGVGVDSRGRIYFGHRGERPLIRLKRDGSWDTEIGAGIMRATTAYDLRGPTPVSLGTRCWMHGLHIDPWDNVWVTDVGRHLVLKFSPDGQLLLTLGRDGVAGCDEQTFNQPTHVAVLSSGEFFVTDGYGNSRLTKFDANGRFLWARGTRGVGPGEFHTPHTVVTDGRGRVFVTDRENDRIQVFSENGDVQDVWEGLHSLDGLCFSNGALFASCGIDCAIVRLTVDGQVTHAWVMPEQLLYPHAIAVDADGCLLVAETGDRYEVTGRLPDERRALPRSGPAGSRLSRWRLPRLA